MIAGVLLAAGESKRMEGAFKPLLKWGTRTVVGECVQQLRKSKLAEIFVVIGTRELEVRQNLTGTGVQYAMNPDVRRGMLSSVKLGWAQIAPSTDAVLIALVDQPMIPTKVINQVIDAFGKTEKSIVIPTYQGKRGHPLIISRALEDELMLLPDDVPYGLKALLDRHANDIQEVPVNAPEILEDIDLPEDYERLSQAVTPHYDFRKWNP